MSFGLELLAAHSLKPLATAAASSLKSLGSSAGSRSSSEAAPSDFAQVLNRATDPAELSRDVQQRIDHLLSAAGIPPSPPVEIAIDPQGRLEISGNHPRAAEIEARLSEDRQLLDALDQLRQTSGQPIQITWPPQRLTNAAPTANILGRPGGYPNW